MINRREFLKIGALAGAGLLIPWELVVPRLLSKVALDSSALTKFVDPLPILPVMQPSGTMDGNPYYEVPMVEFTQKLHSQLPPTTLWGYRGTYPGPTFEVRKGTPVSVKWTNNLPTTHFLPVDPTIHGAESSYPAVRTVVHLHGAKVLPDSDGFPEAWFTQGFAQTGPSFSNQVYHYPNDQLGTTLWYHDHALGITRLNVYSGLAGFYIIRDEIEDQLNLPKGPYEIPLMIQDRMFNTDGSLLYPTSVDGTHTYWIPEFFGDTVLVNGMVWPYLEVEPRRYRFRILNASNARFYHLTLVESDSAGVPKKNPGPVMFQIGSDGGFLPAPVPLNDFLIAKAERYDIIINFAGREGKIFTLKNDALAPFPDGDDIVPADVMQFRVTKPLSGRDTSTMPGRLTPISLYDPNSAAQVRDISINEIDRESDGFPVIAMLENVRWDAPVSVTPKADSIEVWRLINTTEDAHPIHVHLVQFQILDRHSFDESQYPANLVLSGQPEIPGRNERPAWKDTVVAPPGKVTRIIAKFALPTGTTATPGQAFHYIFHCHILEHEDNEMMRPFDVIG